MTGPTPFQTGPEASKREALACFFRIGAAALNIGFCLATSCGEPTRLGLAGRTILIAAHDYAFTGVPRHVPAGWLTIRMVNVGREVHMLGIGRAPYGHTMAEVLDAMAHHRPEPTLEDWGGPNAVSPGDTATVTMFFPPGEYEIACVIESADGQPHILKGMTSRFVVVAGADTGSLQSKDEHASLVSLSDYTVTISGPPLTAGIRTLRVHNDARQGHDLEILQVLPGHSVEEGLRWFEHPATEAAAARALGGVVAMHPGQDAILSVDLKRGTYVFLCWVPDSAGTPHFRRGMQQVVMID